MVLGGGPIGIEMAGEVKEVFPEKNVKLVTSNELMAEPTVTYPAKLKTRLAAKLKSVGVDVFTGVGRVDIDWSAVNECGFITGNKVWYRSPRAVVVLRCSVYSVSVLGAHTCVSIRRRGSVS